MKEGSHEEIMPLLGLPLGELYARIPEHTPEFADVMFGPGEAEKAGREIFESLRSALHQRVCVDWDLPSKLDDPVAQDAVGLTVAVADVVSSLTLGVPPFLIATILVKIGIRQFCSE